MTNPKPCLLKCLCMCGNSRAGHVREMHRPNNFCPREDGHAPGCPNAPHKASEAVACGACMEWDPSCDDCLRASPPLDEPAPAPEPGSWAADLNAYFAPAPNAEAPKVEWGTDPAEEMGPNEVIAPCGCRAERSGDGKLWSPIGHTCQPAPAPEPKQGSEEPPLGKPEGWPPSMDAYLALRAQLAAADQNLKTMLQAAGEEAARQLAEKDKRIEALETELALAVVPDDHEAEERAVLQASLAAAREEIAKLREWRHLEEFVRVEGTLAAEKARADKAEAEVARLTEKERMVDAAISVLSLSNTEKTLVENHLPRENPYWTVAQDDVARAIRREMWQRDRADKAEQRVRELEKAGWTVVKTRKPFDGILPLVESVKALEAILAREQKEGGR